MNERHGKRKKGSGSVYFAVIIALLLLAGILAVSVFFKVTEIKVEGAATYTPQEVIAASGIRLDESIFFLNESSAAVAIKNALGYIDEVRIIKELPGTVTIEVTESDPVAYLESVGSLWVIDKSGKILERTASVKGRRLIELRGAELVMPAVGTTAVFSAENEVRLRYLTETLMELYRSGINTDVSWMDISNLGAITFLYRNEVTVNLGRGDGVQDKLYRLSRVMDNHPEGGRALIDLSDGVSAHYIGE